MYTVLSFPSENLILVVFAVGHLIQSLERFYYCRHSKYLYRAMPLVSGLSGLRAYT